MLNFAAGHPDMAFRADLGNLGAIAEAAGETISHGINHNTAPARNAHLLAALLIYAFTVCKPKSKDRNFIKPSSTLAYPPAIIRIFGRWGIFMPGFKQVSKALDGLRRLYLSQHGPHSPRNAPRTRSSPWSAACSASRPMARGSPASASRKSSETVRDEIMFITYGRLFWCIGNVMVAAPTRAQLLNLRPGRDSAVVFPPRSEPDQWGEAHCPFPVRLTYETTELNPAAALRDLELRTGVQVADRDSRPLFGDAAGADVYSPPPTQPLEAGAHPPLRSHGCSTLPVALLPVEARHGSPCRQRPRLHDHAHMQMDVP